MQATMIVTLVLAGVTFCMGAPILLKFTGRSPGFVNELGFKSGARGNAASWLAAALVVAAYVAFTIAKVPGVRQHALDLSALKLLALFAAAAAGVIEEAIFRRWIMDGVARAGGGKVLQIAASALAFGGAHGTWGFLGGNLHGAVSAAIATTVLGVALGIVYLLSGRSLAPCIAAHAAIDAVIEPGLLLAAVGGFQ